MNEFSLIEQFFKPLSIEREDVLLAIGDDAACLQVPDGMNLLVSTDTLVANVHFLSKWDPYDIACRAVMVNISDLAAMAAKPCWATLALTLPEMNSDWIRAFARGLSDSFKQFGISLVGGDTTRGPLSITLTVFGQAPHAKEVRRSGAKSGDIIFVSGYLGAAALAVNSFDRMDILPEDNIELMNQLIHPKPRVDLCDFLRRYAHAAIDISDGLSADLNHICLASGLGACLLQDSIPLHPLLNKYCPDKAVDLALTGGDDYELCFTVSEHKFESFVTALNKAGLVCYPVGVIEKTPGLRIKTADNQCKELIPRGYTHF